MERQLLVLSILLQNHGLAVRCVCSKSGVCLPKDYDKDGLPSIPVHIDASIDIVQVTEVDDTLATVDILEWMDFIWEDNRLETNSSGKRIANDWIEKFWVPDFFIYRMKSIKMTSLSGFSKPYSGSYCSVL